MVTTNEIVRNVLSQEEKNTTHDYLRYLGYANRGLKVLTYDVLGATKVVLLEVSSALKIDLPGDYVDYTFVGVVGNDGVVQPLGAKGDIPKIGTGNALIKNSQFFTGTNGAVFGAGGGQNMLGYYQPQIDADNNQMLFAATQNGTVIYLEYISDGRAEGGQTIVHEYAEEALHAWIHWKSIQFKRNVSRVDKDTARREFKNEKRLAVARFSSFTKEEALQSIRKGFKQAPKL